MKHDPLPPLEVALAFLQNEESQRYVMLSAELPTVIPDRSALASAVDGEG